MLILSLDTSSAEQIVLLWQDGEVLAQQPHTAQRGQGDALDGMIDAVLADARKTLQQIDRLVVITGVGSFTGLRIGIAAALGLSRGLNKPLWGYQRFDLFSDLVQNPPCVLVFESQREELYVQLPARFPQMLTVGDIMAQITPDVAIAGDATSYFEGYKIQVLPVAAVLAAERCAHAPLESAPLQIEPFYLRAPDVTQPKAI